VETVGDGGDAAGNSSLNLGEEIGRVTMIEEGVLLLRQQGADILLEGWDPNRVIPMEPVGEIDKGF
jgi:hypothetical protein